MEFKREYYINKLINKQNNGMIKVITGIRRCGKSYLLNTLFVKYLKKQGIDDSHIIKIDFDSPRNEKYHDALILFDYLESLIKDKKTYYFLPMLSSETVNLLRPLARRAANTRRPLAVDMRSLKPCLFLRLLLEG